MTRIGIILGSTRPNRNGEQSGTTRQSASSPTGGGARAAEHLRLVAGELQMADVRQQVALSLLTEFENFSVFKPGDYNRAALDTLLDQVITWSAALAPLRQPAAAAAYWPPPPRIAARATRCPPCHSARSAARTRVLPRDTHLVP